MSSLNDAVAFLYRQRLDESRPADEGWAHWLSPLGIISGVSLALLTSLTWGWLGGQLHLAVLPMLLLYWLGPGQVRYAAWARTIGDLRPAVEPAVMLALVAAAIFQYAATGWIESRASAQFGRLPSWLATWIFPRPVLGCIVLMAAWGSASVLLSTCINRAAPSAEPMVHDLFRLPMWLKLTWGLGPVTALSALFLVGWRPAGGWAVTILMAVLLAVAVSSIMFGATMLFGWLLARRNYGHTRTTLLAAGLLGELVFLSVFHLLIN